MVAENRRTRPLLDLAKLRTVLSLVLDRVDADAVGLEYRLVGTAAAVVQGVRLPAGDVDILEAQRGDVERFTAALHGWPCLAAPAWLAEARQYFTRFDVEGVEVEISTVEWPARTDTFECVGRGPWRHHVQLPIGTHVVPAVSLELRLASELVRNRPDRYLPLIDHMQLHGADVQLVLEAMRDRRVDAALQEHVAQQLQRQ